MQAKTCFLFALSALLAGCPPPRKPTVGPGQAGEAVIVKRRATISSVSETEAFAALAVQDKFLYAGTDNGVVRFTLDKDEHVRLTKKEGLSGTHVTAMASHPTSGLWVATEGGVSNMKDGVWTNLPPGKAEVVTMAATDAGIWTGGPRGLARFRNNKWQTLLPGIQVSFLLADLSGDGMWIGTNGEGIFRYTNKGGKDSFVPHSAAKGQPIVDVRSLTFSVYGGLFAVGRTDRGDRLAFFDGSHWTLLIPEPAGALHWVTQVQRRVLLAFDDHVLAIQRGNLTLDGPTKRPVGPVQLRARRSSTAPSNYPLPYFFTTQIRMWFPPNPTVVTGQQGKVLIGTERTGAAVFDGNEVRWYRTNHLVGDSEKLKVGCSSSTCYLAGGGKGHYRDDKGRFVRVAVGTSADTVVQAFVADSSGRVLAIHSPSDRSALIVSVLSGDKAFSKLYENKIQTPGNGVDVRFARLDDQQRLWVGLRYIDGAGGKRPWGVAVFSADGKMVYHRSTLLPTEDRPAGSLALPDDIRDVFVRGSELWLATDSGICRVRGTKVDLFTENEGLESELTYAVGLRNNTNELLVASYGGVGRYDGKFWRYDLAPETKVSSRAVLGLGSQVWAGTSSGLVRLDEKGKTMVLGAADGLASSDVLDLFYEGSRSTLWVLTTDGLSFVDVTSIADQAK